MAENLMSILNSVSPDVLAQAALGSHSLFSNVRRDGAPNLYAAADKLALSSQVATKADDAKPAPGDLLLWEANVQGPDTDFTEDQIAQLQERIRLGGNLLLTLGRSAGKLPIRFSAMLPTMAWATQIGYPKWQQERECNSAVWDDTMFPNNEAQGIKLPFWFPIRPLSAVERGEGRYERYDRKIQKMDRTVKFESETWTRSLLNRDWKVRVSAADRGRSPLVVTGSYGAGRVAVLAGPITGFDTSANATAFWTALLGWLTEKGILPQSATAPAAKPDMTLSAGSSHVQVKFDYHGDQPLTGQLVARVLTWEGALIGDVTPITPGPITLSATAPTMVEFLLPKPSPISYQALDYRHALQLRVAFLSEDGASILVDRRLSLDLDSQVQVSVRTDNLYGTPVSFDAPDQNSLITFKNRMGGLVSSYAYPAGSQVNAQVVISNGLRNLAPWATIVDLADHANASVMALNDEATNYRKAPSDGIEAYSMWSGKQLKDNKLLFSFPRPVTITSITIVGSDGNSEDGRAHNPDNAVIAIDDKEVARIPLEALFVAGYGQAIIPIKPHTGKKLTILFPWVLAEQGRRRLAPWLGEIEVRGWAEDPPESVDGKVVVTLENALTGESHEVIQQEITVDAGQRKVVKAPFTLPVDMPANSFLRLKARFQQTESTIPLMTAKGEKALRPITDILPENGASLSFIVTRGFRTIFDTGTGTQEILAGWAQADDLVWAYSRNLKQIHEQARTQANRLYVTDDDMRHYSTPWKSFANGEYFYDVATPLLVERMKAQPNWSKSPQVRLENSDRWDTGPEMGSVYSWQDYVEFDRELRRRGKPGLKGKTRSQIAAEIHAEHDAEWQGWHLSRYTGAVTKMRDAFAAQQKELTMAAQGLPIVAGPAAAALSPTVRGMADDCTWGMVADSIPLTTGRQVAEIAWNPVWKVSTQGMWGYTSGLLNNEHWHSPVATTEPSRRTLYNRAWRAMVWADGTYGSVYSFGYNSNVGTGYLMTDNDWQQWWVTQQRHSLLFPEAPIGAGLVMSNAYFAEPEHTRFSCGEAFDANDLIPLYARVFEYLHMAAIPIAFGANASTLDQWKGDAPLILLNPGSFSKTEVATVLRLQQRGVKVAAFGGGDLGAAAAIFKQPGVVTLDGHALSFSAAAALRMRPQIHSGLKLPIIFPEGTTGYGFKMGSTNFFVIEDWLEEGRATNLRIRCMTTAKTARACNVNDHVNVPVKRDGDFWQLAITLRPGDGTLFALEEIA
jgi:hypothetical protein